MALKKLCRCGKIIDYTDKYCVECTNKHLQEKKDTNKYYDINHRKNKDIYSDTIWRKLTEICKNKFNGIDIYSLFVYNKLVYGSLSHHIVEVDEDKNRIYDISNLIYVSDASHREIHSAYNKGGRVKKDMQELLFSLITRYEIG